MSIHGRNLSKRLKKYFRPNPLLQTSGQLTKWLDETAQGSYLLAQEKMLVNQLPKLPGYHLLELGIDDKARLLDCFDNYHRFYLSGNINNGCSAVAEFDSLPLPNEVIDNVIIHHALEFSSKPHQVLNEAARIITPGGHMLLVVLNPFSGIGLAKWPARLMNNSEHWRYHSLRMSRVLDWLRLLHFKPVSICRSGFGLKAESSINGGFLKRRGYAMGLPTGMFYVIVAKKQVYRPVQNRKNAWSKLTEPVVAIAKPQVQKDQQKQKI